MPMDPASRREFLLSAGVFGAAALLSPIRTAKADEPPASGPAPPTLHRAAPDVEGALTRATFVEAEKLASITFNDTEREMMAEHIDSQLALTRKRLEYPFHPNTLAPAMRFDPRLPGMHFSVKHDHFIPLPVGAPPLPDSDEDIAFAPLTHLAQWIHSRRLTSTRLTDIYLERLKRYDDQIKCVITLTEDLALVQAKRADAEIAAGRYRGPLHGIPWGAKDLLDTAGIPTTWGAEPYRDRVPDADAHVVKKLEEAGAVLVAKLSLGALAYNDIWFGGRTNNPWNIEQGSSGSSAGSAAATVAGLVGFAIGTETYGSIVSPCMRCGATGLRPTFGRVGRTGAMALCWSLDKIGPICRTVEDCILVLKVINGYDEGDPSSIDMPLSYSPSPLGEGSWLRVPRNGQGARKHLQHMRIAYNPAWFERERVHQLDRDALEAMKSLGAQLVEIDLPDLPYDSLLTILFAEAAASFEELTRTGKDDLLTWQEPDAWPNTFRQSWFIPAIEMVQADRLRRLCMEIMKDTFEVQRNSEGIDAIIAPSFAASLLLITNNTGHPSITLRSGFRNNGSPHGITLIGRLFDEGTLCAVAMALEREMDVWHKRPSL